MSKMLNAKLLISQRKSKKIISRRTGSIAHVVVLIDGGEDRGGLEKGVFGSVVVPRWLDATDVFTW
jgi:hypothetical protein